MPERFTNTSFFASTVDGKRRPVATNIDEDPTPIENPDPGGDGGGGQNPGGDQGGGDQGTGGDIGNPTGAVETTLGAAPTLTRESHSEDIWATQGVEFSITYVASGPCTILPKFGFDEMVVSYSDDGLKMTLTYTPPIDMPGDSWYIGAEAHVYGGDTSEAISDIYDIVHIGKNPLDIKNIGIGTNNPVIQDALENIFMNYSAGDTIIVADGVYSDDRDHISVGYYGYATNAITPNGVRGEVVTVPTYGVDSVTQTGTETIQKTTKYTTIMSRTPLGAILERQDRYRSIKLYGDYREFSTYTGFRETFGIKVKGFALRNAIDSLYLQYCDSCEITDCSIIQDANPTDWGADNPYNQPSYWSDGGIVLLQGTRNCRVSNVHGIGNARAAVFTSRGSGFESRGAKHSQVSRSIMGHGCINALSQTISQTYLQYGARNFDFLNCWAIDAAFFAGGMRGIQTGAGISVNDHFSFQWPRGSADTSYCEGLLALYSTRGGVKSELNAEQYNAGGRITIKESVFFDKTDDISGQTMLVGVGCDISNITVGKNQRAEGTGAAAYETSGNLNNMLVLWPEWDYPYSSGIITGYSTSGDDFHAYIPNEPPSGYTANIENTLTIPDGDTKSSGAHYLGRIDDDSSLGIFGAGCRNLFATVGNNVKEPLDKDRTRYDGKNGNKYVNWVSRSPWRQWRTEKQTYSTTVDGVTYTGNVGWATNGVNPTDYVNRQGTSPNHPINAPFIDDIYGYVVGSTAYIKWRPVCAAYRSTITGYDLYIDGIRVTENQPKESTGAQFDNVASGTRLFNVVVRDPTYGNSAFSRTVFLTIP